MTKAEVDKNNFQELIEKYLDGKTTLEEVKLLVNYYESYQQGHIWGAELGSEELVQKRMLINILEELQSNNPNPTKVISFYKKPLFKYIAAASIALLISLTIIFNNGNLINKEGVNSNFSNIEVGTNKATLMLADGTEVTLKKGASYQRQNIKSNGEQIVYVAEGKNLDEVEYNFLTVPRGGQFSIKLSDGTQVWLNSESKLKYPKTFINGEARKVELVYGEAYFDVSPSSEHNGSKFLVVNDSQEVEVLGTEFNIKAYKEEPNIYTTLVEGSVGINIDNRRHNLVPGQQLFLNKTNRTLLIKKVDVFNETAWKDGVFSFEDKSLREIMVVLARWYDIEVVFENQSINENEEFVGVLRKSQKIDEILMSIKNFGIIKNYNINDKKVTLN